MSLTDEDKKRIAWLAGFVDARGIDEWAPVLTSEAAAELARVWEQQHTQALRQRQEKCAHVEVISFRMSDGLRVRDDAQRRRVTGLVHLCARCDAPLTPMGKARWEIDVDEKRLAWMREQRMLFDAKEEKRRAKGGAA